MALRVCGSCRGRSSVLSWVGVCQNIEPEAWTLAPTCARLATAMTPRYRPSVQQELSCTRRCSRARSRVPPGAGRALVACELLDVPSQSLLPLVYKNVVRFGDANSGIEALKERYVSTWRENHRFYHGCFPAAGLRAGRHRCRRPRGTGPDRTLLPRSGLRPMANVDVLVPPSDIERASELAVSLGWHPRYRLTPHSSASSMRGHSTTGRAWRVTFTGECSKRPAATGPTKTPGPTPSR